MLQRQTPNQMLNGRKLFLFIMVLIIGVCLLFRLDGFTRHDLRSFLHRLGLQANGQIRNYSSKPLWVIVSRQNRSWAYRLQPHQQSPESVDADAVKSMNGTPIQADTVWHKVLDGVTGDVTDGPSGLQIDCLLCYPEHNQEFNHILYTKSVGWGMPLYGNTHPIIAMPFRCSCGLLNVMHSYRFCF